MIGTLSESIEILSSLLDKQCQEHGASEHEVITPTGRKHVSEVM